MIFTLSSFQEVYQREPREQTKEVRKGYYKNHPCQESFTCKVCGRLVTPGGAGSDHRNHCPNCLSSLHVDIEPGDRNLTAEASWTRSQSRTRKTANGPSSTAAAAAESFIQPDCRR